MTACRGYLAGLALITAVSVLAGCGSTPAGSTPAGSTAGVGRLTLPLATSLAGPGGTSWAVIRMGRASRLQDDFWQLFAWSAGATKWRLATPAGVADNGGLVVAGTGTRSLITGFRPSQDLTFSPLAATADAGARWSQDSLVSPGLADVPDALAAGPGGRLIALTGGGTVELETRLGAAWTRLTSEQALARTPAGRACGLAGLTGVAFTGTGTPLLAGGCRTPGQAGIFALRGGQWGAAGPALPAAMAGHPVQVVGLGTAGARSTALLAAGRRGAAVIVAAWSGDGGQHWTLSPRLPAGSLPVRSAALWAGGAAGLVLAAGRGETIAGPGASWQPLPALPAGTQALARDAGGRLDALVAARSTMSAWQLGRRGGWTRQQTLRVTIPYGSSG
jgi:hypothetical protein